MGGYRDHLATPPFVIDVLRKAYEAEMIGYHDEAAHKEDLAADQLGASLESMGRYFLAAGLQLACASQNVACERTNRRIDDLLKSARENLIEHGGETFWFDFIEHLGFQLRHLLKEVDDVETLESTVVLSHERWWLERLPVHFLGGALRHRTDVNTFDLVMSLYLQKYDNGSGRFRKVFAIPVEMTGIPAA